MFVLGLIIVDLVKVDVLFLENHICRRLIVSASQCGPLGIFSSGCVNLDINYIVLLLPVHRCFVTFSRVVVHIQINIFSIFYLLFFLMEC